MIQLSRSLIYFLPLFIMAIFVSKIIECLMRRLLWEGVDEGGAPFDQVSGCFRKEGFLFLFIYFLFIYGKPECMCFVVGYLGERNNRNFRVLEREAVHVWSLARFNVSFWVLVLNLFRNYLLGLIFLD